MANDNTNTTRLENGIAFFDSTVAVNHDVYINGEFSGKIASNSKVVIDEKAVINGTVIAQDVEIMGRFEGECIVKKQLVLHKGCSFTGKLSYGDIVSETGVIVKGTFNKISEKAFDEKLAQDPSFQHLIAPAGSKKPISKKKDLLSTVKGLIKK